MCNWHTSSQKKLENRANDFSFIFETWVETNIIIIKYNNKKDNYNNNDNNNNDNDNDNNNKDNNINRSKHSRNKRYPWVSGTSAH